MPFYNRTQCACCGKKNVDTTQYLEGYPREYKLCCLCVEILKIILLEPENIMRFTHKGWILFTTYINKYLKHTA